MMNKKDGGMILAGVFLMCGLAGCGGKSADAGGATGASGAATGTDAVQKRLNDPSVSPQEKDMIRRSQGANGAAPAPGGTSDNK